MTADWNHLWEDYAASAEENPAQAYRRALVTELLELGPGSESARILDLGSGQGDFARELKRRFPYAEIRGLDISAAGVRMAQEKVPQGRFLEADLTRPLRLPEDWTGWATHMVCTELLEHLQNPAEVLANARPLLGVGARIVITVPSGPMSAFDRFLGHVQHFSPASLTQCIQAGGGTPVIVLRAGFPFFNLYRLVVILRGERLVEDAARVQEGAPSRLASWVMALFRFLFRFNARRWGPGWQLVAVAKVPAALEDPT
jgi:SAM-dependent methyltransferase